MADITITQRRGFTEIIVKNDMTIFSAMDDFDQHIKPAKYKKMVKIDLSDVVEIDTAGIQILVVLVKYLSEQGSKFTFTALSEPVTSYISLFKLHTVFQLKEEQ